VPHSGYNVTDGTRDKLWSYCILTGTLCYRRRDYFNIKQSTAFSCFAYYSCKGSPIKHMNTNYMFRDVPLEGLWIKLKCLLLSWGPPRKCWHVIPNQL
jgi:hypothetical protein